MKTGKFNPMFLVVAALLLPAAAQAAVVRYVALNGSGTNGQTWATAYKTIQAALDDPAVTTGGEIWVKQGTYAIASHIQVNKAVTILGGYSGSGTTRNPVTYETTVDGGDTAKHGFEVIADATIDGFTITRGSAWGITPGDKGGGMYIGDCSPVISNCTFYRNHAANVGGAIAAGTGASASVTNCAFVENTASYGGGGICCELAEGVTITDCTFSGNASEYSGGGMFNHESVVAVTGCTFNGNSTAWIDQKGGGGVLNEGGAPVFANCTFTGGISPYGAGLCNYYSDAVIDRCTFADCNTATVGGGGIRNIGGAPTISNCLFQNNRVESKGAAVLDQSAAQFINCLFRNNSTLRDGGAIYIHYELQYDPAATQFINCTMYGNRASNGGALYSYSSAPVLTNCILWGNEAVLAGPGIYNNTLLWAVEAVAAYCDIQGESTYPGTGNLRIDPAFEDPTAGDFHLSTGSPCIDAGSNAAVSGISEDYEGGARIADGDGNGSLVVDMGAFEVQGPPDHLARGEIIRSVAYDHPGDSSARYTFTMLLETDDTVDHVQFQAPGGATLYTIPSDPYTSAGNVDTYHRIEGDAHVWEYWVEADDAAALAAFGDGTYSVSIHYLDASQDQTEVTNTMPGTGTPIGQPTQVPYISAPAYDAGVGSPVTLVWDACSDGNVNSILLTVVESDSGLEVGGGAFAESVTQTDAYTLREGVHNAECAFANLHEVVATDGTPFTCGKAIIMEHRFEVLYTSVYRFWSGAKKRHFYTIRQSERDKLITKYSDVWTYEGPVYNACSTSYHQDLAPVYRFWSARNYSHFYTTRESEKAKLINDFPDVWTYEGVAFYAYPPDSQPPECTPVYRFWSGINHTHFYTTSEREKNKLIDNYAAVYTYEGIAYYAYP